MKQFLSQLINKVRLARSKATPHAQPVIMWPSEKFIHERIATLMAEAGIPECRKSWIAFCKFEADLRSAVCLEERP